MSDEEIRALKAAAWDEGYAAGSNDGYFMSREHTNPYRDEEKGA